MEMVTKQQVVNLLPVEQSIWMPESMDTVDRPVSPLSLGWPFIGALSIRGSEAAGETAEEGTSGTPRVERWWEEVPEWLDSTHRVGGEIGGVVSFIRANEQDDPGRLQNRTRVRTGIRVGCMADLAEVTRCNRERRGPSSRPSRGRRGCVCWGLP